MRKFLPIIAMPLLFCGCVGMSTTDGDSTKQWISIVSSQTDVDGSTTDVCYQLNLRFNPAEAQDRIDTDLACITRCCWYSENKVVQMDFNEKLPEELVFEGSAKKYNPEQLTIRVSYSPFLKTIHAKADQRGVLSSDGLVQLDYDQIDKPENFFNLDFGTQTPMEYNNVDAHAGTYLYSSQKAAAEKQLAADKKLAAERKAKAEIALADKTKALQDAEEAAEEAAKEQAEQAKAAAKETAVGVQTAVKNKAEEVKNNYASMDEAERQALLEKMQAYERQQAVLLVKRFYNKEIDAYIMAIDKAKKAKGLVLMSNDRDWTTVKTGTPIYRVACKVNGKLGKTVSTMKSFPISCGTYEVNLDEKTVVPADTAAISIVNGEYIN